MSLVLITTTPTAAGTVHGPALLYLNGNFLTRFHAHPANRNYRPAHKTPPDQSKIPLHVGIMMWVIKLTNSRSEKFSDSVDLVELRGFRPIGASQGATTSEARRAGSAVGKGKFHLSIKVTWAHQAQS